MAVRWALFRVLLAVQMLTASTISDDLAIEEGSDRSTIDDTDTPEDPGYDREVPTDERNPEVPTDECDPHVPTDECDPDVPTDECDPDVPTEECDPHVPTEECDPHVPTEECDPHVPTDECDHDVPTDECDPDVPTEKCDPHVPTEKSDVCVNGMDDDLGNTSTADASNVSAVEGTSCPAGKAAELPRPKCDEERGCDSPLSCFDFRNLETSIIPDDPPYVVKVTPYELEGILENSSMTNCCAVVMFYAPWCEFSVRFARKYNALGRSFNGLPILAVDLGEHEPYKYVLAYLPVVAFYYRGKALFKLKLSSTYEELRSLIMNVTGFPSQEIDLSDDENEYPVPTQRENSDRFFLYFATWWLIFVAMVFVLKSRTVVVCVEHLRTKIGWSKPEKTANCARPQAESGTMTDMQQCLRSIIPALTYAAHKGMAGRIGVIGGSLEYTGAPYFAAISAMRAGADLGHVFCPEAAAAVIKTYSPELIVHPLLSGSCSESTEAIIPWFPRLHALVIGPGLGRDPAILSTVKLVIAVAKQQQKDIVIDADGLYLVTSEPEVVTGYTRTILTPNAVEFQRLYEKMLGTKADGDPVEQTRTLANKMGNLVILRKGEFDIISDGSQVLQCHEEGCPRRCGGQGDLLSGTIGLFSHWARQSEKQLAVTHGSIPPLVLAAYGGCLLVKRCAKLAFSKHKRSMLAGDMLTEIPTAFQTIFEPEDNSNQQK